MDQLFKIFEQHLFNALVEEESTEDFITRVVSDYMDLLQSNNTVIPREYVADLESDLKDEVLEMLRKKTYGHYDLNAFRNAKGIAAPKSVSLHQNEKARRSGRAS